MFNKNNFYYSVLPVLPVLIVTLFTAPHLYAEEDYAEGNFENDYSLADLLSLPEIIVTARKRDESLQDIPMAVSAYNANTLENALVTNITDLERMTPNISVVETGGLVTGLLLVFIRGIGNDPGFSQGAGVYVDDVYLNRTTGSLLEVYDIERIEVLKGPQGNLYGRNSIGGAIKYITKEPTDEFVSHVEIKTDRFGLAQIKANVSGPIIDESLLGNFGVLTKVRDGVQTNKVDGKEFWSNDISAFHGSLVYYAAPNIKLKLAADYSVDESAPRVPVRLAVDEDTLNAIGFIVTGAGQYFGSDAAIVNSPNDISLPTMDDQVNTEFSEGFDKFEVETRTIAFTTVWDVNDQWELKSVTAARNVDNFQAYDFDGSDQQFITTEIDPESNDYTQEFQFNYTSDTIKALIGLYYLDGMQDSPLVTYQYPRLRAIQTHTTVAAVDRREVTSQSVYTNVYWDFADDWQLSLGGRYTLDEKKETRSAVIDQGFFAFAGAFPDLPAGSIVAVAPGQEATAELDSDFVMWFSQFTALGNTRFVSLSSVQNTVVEDKWTELSPSANLSYQINDTSISYIGYASGFKSGGFQRNGATASTYQPETVNSSTIGIKSVLLNGSLRINAEVFLYDYTNKQLAVIELIDNVLTETVSNVGEVTTSGGEIEMAWLPGVNGLALSLNIGYLDANVDSYKTVDSVTSEIVDISSTTEIGYSPRWSMQAGVSYDMTLDSGNLRMGCDVAYRSSSYTNSPIDTTSLFADVQVQEEHAIWNAMMAYVSQDEKWRVAMEGRNLANKRVVVHSFEVGPIVTGGYNMPRTWAMSLGYSF